jgi:hypothetical protein
MTYQYDVFVSYRRTNDWPRYVEKLFYPMLQHWLDTTLGRASPVYLDVRLKETGQSWPHKLAEALSASKVMVCLWSKEYFDSDWCRAELSHMLARRAHVAGDAAPPPLILAVLIHDGEDLQNDPDLGDIQQFALQHLSNPWMTEGSSSAEQLSAELRLLAEDIEKAIGQVPNFDPDWLGLARDEFLTLFRRRTQIRQLSPPSLAGR